MARETIRLHSTPLIHAPSVFKYACEIYRSGGSFSKRYALNLIKSWEGDMTDQQWTDLLTGVIPHRIEGEVVAFEIGEDHKEAAPS